MEFDRGSPLRIRDVNVANGGCDHRVTENALYLGQVNTRFKKIGRATVTELMKTVKRRLGIARDGVHSVADGKR